MTRCDCLQPLLTLDAVFGPDLLLSPRPSPNACCWLPQDEALLDNLTGGMLTVLGRMPVLCSAGVATPEGLRLLQDAGLPVSAPLHLYPYSTYYLACLAKLATPAGIALQHVHLPTDLPPHTCWVAPETLSYLNNKANLADLVEDCHCPKRWIVPRFRLGTELTRISGQVVIKAITEQSSGGGSDVLIVHGHEELAAAPEFFRSCEEVVIEDFLPMERNLCLNYAVTASGHITFLGSAEQVVDYRGRYQGNWIDAQSCAPDHAVAAGLQVVKEAFARGYWGCVGIDLALLADDRVLIYDLNFRLNGSTPALLWSESLRRRYGATTMRFASLAGRGTFPQLLDAAYRAMTHGWFLPLSTFSPDAAGIRGASPRLGGLILGQSRAEVVERQVQLAELGLA